MIFNYFYKQLATHDYCLDGASSRQSFEKPVHVRKCHNLGGNQARKISKQNLTLLTSHYPTLIYYL
jgi:hypothetical protein